MRKVSLGIQVYKSYLHWALKSVNITYIWLFGFYKLLVPFHCPFDSPLLLVPPSHEKGMPAKPGDEFQGWARALMVGQPFLRGLGFRVLGF